MMGKTHAATGLLAGLLVAPAVGTDTPQTLVFAATTAGYALLPDLDHPNARASRLLGPITGLLSRGLRAASAALYQATKGPRDENGSGTHRHLSHTVLFALICGAATAGAAGITPWASLAVVVFGLLLAEHALGDWVLPAAVGAATWWLIGLADPMGELATLGPLLGLAVAVGCITHCLGDALTLSGCPFLFPLPIAGETWYEIRPPRWLRFRTGSAWETRLIFPATLVGCVAAIPGLLPLLLELTAHGARLAGGHV